MSPPSSRRHRHHRRRRRGPRRRASPDQGRPLGAWSLKRATAPAGAAIPSILRPTSCSTSAAAGCIRPTKNSFVGIAGSSASRSTRSAPPWASSAYEAAFPPRSGDSTRRLEAFYERCEEAARGRGRRRQRLSRTRQSLEPDDRRGLDLRQRLRTRSGLGLDMDEYEDTERNWRVRKGYGALMTAYAALPDRVRDRRRDHRSFRQAAAHQDLAGHDRADKVIVTVPTNFFAEERSGFIPSCRTRSRPRAACRSASPTR